MPASRLVWEGSVIGTLTAEHLVLDLNPNVADDNVYLDGAFVLERITDAFAGAWHHSTLLGSVAAGFFTASKHAPLSD